MTAIYKYSRTQLQILEKGFNYVSNYVNSPNSQAAVTLDTDIKNGEVDYAVTKAFNDLSDLNKKRKLLIEFILGPNE